MISKAKHVAIIMDGNGRWAQGKRHTRVFGHVKGARRVHDLTEACVERKIEALTLYTFSTENWLRPDYEVTFLMKLLRRYLSTERKSMLDNDIRFQCIGFMDRVPNFIRKEVDALELETRDNKGMKLTLALSYGARQEITAAIQSISELVKNGEICKEDITEDLVQQHLFTKDLPNPDLLIRTGGDFRVSNYLLWQIAYTELYFTDCRWPDFTVEELDKALNSYSARERRYGQTSEQVSLHP